MIFKSKRFLSIVVLTCIVSTFFVPAQASVLDTTLINFKDEVKLQKTEMQKRVESLKNNKKIKLVKEDQYGKCTFTADNTDVKTLQDKANFLAEIDNIKAQTSYTFSAFGAATYFSDGYLRASYDMNLARYDPWNGGDSLTTWGQSRAYWFGSVPMNANEVYSQDDVGMALKNDYVTVSAGFPAYNVVNSQFTSTFYWPTIPDNWYVTNTSGQETVYSDGIYSYKQNARATFRFGGNNVRCNASNKKVF